MNTCQHCFSTLLVAHDDDVVLTSQESFSESLLTNKNKPFGRDPPFNFDAHLFNLPGRPQLSIMDTRSNKTQS